MDLDPNDLFERAKRALMAGDAASAAEDARVIVRIAPTAWAAHYLLAMAEAASGRSGAALEHYRRTVELRPGHADAWLALSLAEAEAGDQAAARRAVEQAVEAEPRHVRALTLLGWRRHADGDGEAAAVAMRRAVELAPADGRTVRALAEVEADRGTAALSLFERAAALDSRDTETALAAAVARHAAGDREGGLTRIESLTRAAPDWVAPLNALAKLAIADGDPARATGGFVKALALRPRDLGLWRAYLGTLAKLDDHAAVLAAAAQARVHLGDHPLLAGATAVALDEIGDHDQAGVLLQRLDETATNGAFAEARVRNLLRSGQAEQAERRAATAVTRPDGRGLWPYLATVWRLLDDPRWAWLEAPEFIQAVDIESGAEIAAHAAPVLRALHTARAAPLGQTLRGGSQTDGPLFLRREPQIQRLAAALKAAVEAYARTLPPPDPDHPLLRGPRGRLRFVGSWSVRLAAGGMHVNHVHPDGWVSSAFYVALPRSAPEGSTDGWLALGEPPKELNLDLPPFRLIEPRVGRLALFPSYTWHGTQPHPAGERLTCAFDMVAE